MRINSSGLVGIGQATPTHMLHVDSSNASDSTATAFFKGRIIRFDGAASTHSPRLNLSLDGTDKATILLHRTNDDLEIQTLTASPIRFSPNSTERVRIGNGGNVDFFGGITVTGITTLSGKVGLDTTGALNLPRGTTSERPTDASTTTPYIRWNTTNSALEFYNGSSWVEIISDYFPQGSLVAG